jgi:hypothetical protein
MPLCRSSVIYSGSIRDSAKDINWPKNNKAPDHLVRGFVDERIGPMSVSHR